MNLKKLATSFSRGLNQAASHTLNDGECQVSENFVFKDRAATVREGFQIHAQVTSGPIVSLEKFYQADGDAFFTAIGNGQLHYSITSGVFVSISSDPISGDISKTVYDGAMYFTNFSTPVKFFNGDYIDIAGLSSPVFKNQLDDCENAARWVAQDVNGGIIQDTNYMHRDKGKKAITVFASNPSTAHVSQYGSDKSLDVRIEDFANSPPRNCKNAMCMDTSGNIHVIANQGSGSTSSLYHYMSPNYGSTWTVTQACSGKAYQVGGQIHPNYSGGISLIYNSYSYFWFSNWTSQSGWRDVVTSGPLLSLSSLYVPVCSTDIDRSGHIHLVAKLGHSSPTCVVNYAKFNITSNLWSSISSIYSFNGYEQFQNNKTNQIDICISRSNVPNISFFGLNATSGFIGVYNGISGLLDTSSIGVDKDVIGLNQISRICIDASSNLNLIYKDYDNYFHRILYNGSGAWSTAYNVHPTADGNQLIDGVPLINYSSRILNFIWGGTSVASPSIPTLRHATFQSGAWSAVNNYDKYPLADYAFSAIDGVWTSSNNRMRNGWSVLHWGSGYTMNYKASQNAEYFNSPQAVPVFDLTKFAPDVTSHSGYDCIQFFTVPNRKESISSFLLKFVDAAGYQAIANITSTSAWASCSNHEWGMTITYPKGNMSSTNAAFAWNACDMQIALTPVSGQGLAKVAIDNIRLLNSPPIINSQVVTPAKIDLTFWGSSSAGKKFGVPIVPGLTGGIFTGSDTGDRGKDSELDDMQLEGIKQIADPLPNGTYYYKTTFVKESPSGFEIESNPTFQSSGWIVSSNTSSWTYLNLIAVPVAPSSFGVTARRIYRRRSKDKAMRFVYTMHDNVETTFNDTVPAITLGWALEEDHNPPPSAKFLFRGSDQRMYYFNISENGENYHSRARISKPYEPYYVPHANTVDISPDDGTEGTGIFEFAGIVHFLKERSTWNVEQGLVCKNPSIGCVASDSIATGRNEVFWLSDQGPIMYNGQFHNIGHSRDWSSLYRIQTILDRLPKDYLKNAKGTYYDGYYLLAITDSGSTVNNMVLCYDVDNDTWTTFPNMNVTSWSVWNGYKDGYRLFFGNTSGQICEMFAGNYDVSTPINYKIQSKDFGIPSPEEFYRKGYLFTENLDGTLKTVTGQPYYNFIQTSSDAESIEISGTHNTTKFVFPAKDSASFFSFGFSGSGRIKINVAEIYRKGENLR